MPAIVRPLHTDRPRFAMSLPAAAPDPTPLPRRDWLVPAVLLAGLTVLVWWLDLDRAVSARFHDPASATGWPAGEAAWWRFWYRFASAPAIVLFAAGLLALASGLSHPRRAWRRYAGAVLVLSLLLGPALLVNGVLKPGVGRPRPRHIEAFGGEQRFAPVLWPVPGSGEESFPSGHAAAGFAPLAAYFPLRRRRARAAWPVLAAALGYGGMIGTMRIVQGGHFLSDVAWSAGVVYFTAYAVDRWLALPLARAGPLRRDWHRGALWAAAAALAALVVGGYLVSLPYSAARTRLVSLPPAADTVRLEVTGAAARQGAPLAADGPRLRLRTRIDGRGLPYVRVETAWTRLPSPDAAPRYRYDVRVRGLVAGRRVTTEVAAPAGVQLLVEPARRNGG